MADSNNNVANKTVVNHNIVASVPLDYRSTWGNELEMDYAIPNDYSDELRWRLEQNDPSVQVMRFPRWWDMNDADLARLAQALAQNTFLQSLRLDFSPTEHTNLTPRGMEVLAEGIRQSSIEYLMLDGPCSMEVQRSLFQGIWQSTTIRTISFVAKQVNIHALRDLLAPITIMMRRNGPDLPFHLKELDIRECDMTNDQMQMLSAGLGGNRSIKTLSLYNCSLTDQHLATFCEHWQESSGIEEIDLRGNRLTAAGAELVIQASEKHPKMHRIALSDNPGIGYEGFQRLGQGVFATTHMEGFCVCSSVPADYRNTPMPIRDAAFAAVGEALRRNQNSTFLILRENGIGPNGAQAILRGIASHPNFSNLGLSKNREIGYEGFKLIGQELGRAGLDDLNLESCVDLEVAASQPPESRLEACEALANGLRENPSVKEIMLGNNGIDATGARTLVRGIAHHRSLTKLALAQNKSIGHEGLKWIGQELPSLRLEELDLTDCTLGASNPKLLDTKSANEAGQALVEGLKRNVHLRQLALGDMDLSVKWKTELEFYLDLNRCGRYIMQEENVPLTLWCEVFDYLEDDVSQMYYFLKEQPWLVEAPTTTCSCEEATASRKRKTTDELL